MENQQENLILTEIRNSRTPTKTGSDLRGKTKYERLGIYQKNESLINPAVGETFVVFWDGIGNTHVSRQL